MSGSNRGKIAGAIRFARRGLSVLLALTFFYAVGFFWFMSEIPLQNATPEKADAIVVLTGGPERIDAAMGLLSAHKGDRLLVSGVHPRVKREELRDLIKGDAALFDCCVDLGKQAETTIGNATEAASWAKSHDYKSLIVVTSAYHLPRSLRELSRTMPNAKLSGFAVFHSEVRLDDWWLYPGTARLLVSEYSKFLLTLVRLSQTEDI
ncbi:MAG: YdcF family protein [Parvibaculum sp.]